MVEVRKTLGECGRCHKFRLLAFVFYRGDKGTDLCIACGGEATVYLHRKNP